MWLRGLCLTGESANHAAIGRLAEEWQTEFVLPSGLNQPPVVEKHLFDDIRVAAVDNGLAGSVIHGK